MWRGVLTNNYGLVITEDESGLKLSEICLHLPNRVWLFHALSARVYAELLETF